MVDFNSLSSGEPRWQRRPDARPEEILEAAKHVFGESGYAGTKLEDVARRAGVSKGTLYLYFDSKEALFREMVRAKVVAALAHAEETVRTFDGSSRELLVLLVSSMYRRLRDEGMARVGRVVQAELPSFPELAQFYFEEVIVRSRRLVSRVLERGVESGEFREVSHGFAARGLASLLVHTAQLQCFFHDFDPDQLSDEAALGGLVDLYLHGVLARPGEPA
ncbi:MAG TPA: TetR/AcrR family transcriptional regulator [Gemmatimonadales bacterium]|nr:TetR/AcrR family transcriptional regulator [Gemmatimonadales bacterium]